MICNLNTPFQNNSSRLNSPLKLNREKLREKYSEIAKKAELTTRFKVVNVFASVIFSLLCIVPYSLLFAGAALMDITVITTSSFSKNLPPTQAPTKWETVKNFIKRNQKPILAAIFMSGLALSAYTLRPNRPSIEPKFNQDSNPTVSPELNQNTVYKNVFQTALAMSAAYNLFDEGLSKILCLETLRHGTGPLGYFGIYRNGADPSKGGNQNGSSYAGANEAYIRDSENYFHVFKDSEFSINPSQDFQNTNQGAMISILKIILPRYHAMLSGMASFGHSSKHLKNLTFPAVIGATVGLATPTIKFRFTPESTYGNDTIFENDDDYYGFAYKTREAISIKHIGMIGTLSQGINRRMFSRMKSNPLKVAHGASLIAASFFTSHYFVLGSAIPSLEQAISLISSKMPSALTYTLSKVAKTSFYFISLVGI